MIIRTDKRKTKSCKRVYLNKSLESPRPWLDINIITLVQTTVVYLILFRPPISLIRILLNIFAITSYNIYPKKEILDAAKNLQFHFLIEKFGVLQF